MASLATMALASLLLTGCAHAVKQFAAPDATELIRAQQRLGGEIAGARKSFSEAAVHVRRGVKQLAVAEASHSKEVTLQGEIGPGIAALRTRLTDAVLRDELDAIARQFSELTAQSPQTTESLKSASEAFAVATARLTEGIAQLADADGTAHDIETKYGADYRAAAEGAIRQANAAIVATDAHAQREAAAKVIWFWIAITAIAATAVLGALLVRRKASLA